MKYTQSTSLQLYQCRQYNDQILSELIVPDRPIYSQAISKYTYYVLCTKTIGHYFKHIFLYCKRGLRVGGQRSVLRRRPSLGKPQKKVLLLMTGPLKKNPRTRQNKRVLLNTFGKHHGMIQHCTSIQEARRDRQIECTERNLMTVVLRTYSIIHAYLLLYKVVQTKSPLHLSYILLVKI